jgi:hypothetical protein
MPIKFRNDRERRAHARKVELARRARRREKLDEKRVANVSRQCSGDTVRPHKLDKSCDGLPYYVREELLRRCRRMTKHPSGLCISCRKKRAAKVTHTPLKTALKKLGLS